MMIQRDASARIVSLEMRRTGLASGTPPGSRAIWTMGTTSSVDRVVVLKSCCGKFDPIGTRKRTGLHERIADSNAENFLPIVQVFGVQHRRTGPRRCHNHQRIPE